MAEVALSGVRKSYGKTEVVHGVDLNVADGEFIVVVGPSGCGKSTLLRMIAGLEEISGGEISISGRRVNDLEPKDRDVAMVFQNYALYPHMSVFDNMAYGLKLRGLPKGDIRARVEKAAGLLALGDFLDRRPRALSGGQRQRVAMGRAIVREPSVFLFDEPLSNLDAKLRVQMRIEIKRLQRQLGVTSFYVTHDQIEAMTLGDRLVVMNAGRAEQIGAPLEVYSRPATRFVAGFIGSPSMNFLPAQVSGGAIAINDGPTTRTPGLTTPGALGEGRKVLLGVRPEHLSPVTTGSADGVSLTIDLVEPLGADTVIYGRMKGSPDEITVRLPGATTGLTPGAAVHFTIDTAATHLFDAESGQRL